MSATKSPKLAPKADSKASAKPVKKTAAKAKTTTKKVAAAPSAKLSKVATKVSKSTSIPAIKAVKKVVEFSKPKGVYFYGVGRRKAAVVRSKYFPNDDTFEIYFDKKRASEYLPLHFKQQIDNIFLVLGIKTGIVQFFARGGGVSGQVDAARLALAHSLLKWDESLSPVLHAHGMLTTDIRKVIPKKAGRRKARKVEQWSKR
jgi:small subunit ribosomal protein S9